MKSSVSSRYALSVCAATILLPACGGSQNASPSTSVPLTQTSASGPASHERFATKMRSKDLIYVGYGLPCGTFCSTASVNVYTFPEGRPAGSWEGTKGSYTSDECADAAGNVFVTYSYSKSDVWQGEILKFAHGATSPEATLSVGKDTPVACSVDPNSGDLAVVNVVNGSDTGALLIFSNGSGSPTVYSDPGVIFYGVSYDDLGNIFADGVDEHRHRVTFAELPKAGTSFEKIALDKLPGTAGEVQWDGQYVTLAFGVRRDENDGLKIERLDISRKSGHVVGVTQLQRLSHDANSQYWIAGSQVIGAWYHAPHGCPVSGCSAQPGGVGTWNYPTGSMITKRITRGDYRSAPPGGVALSSGDL
jgi:hypothetical protein